MAHYLRFSAIPVVLLTVLVPSIGSICQSQSPETIDAERRTRQAELFRETLEARERRERQAELFTKKPAPANDTVDSVDVAADTTITKPPNYDGRWVVFVIPGTYGNTGAWFHTPQGMATFSSEVQTALGSNAVVYPSVWQSSVHHNVREKLPSYCQMLWTR